MLRLVFCDTDKELQKLVARIPWLNIEMQDDYNPESVDIIHTASNPSFRMGGGWDLHLSQKYDVCFQKELEIKNKIVSLISVNSNLIATPQLVYEAYRKYFDFVKTIPNTQRVGVVGLGCGIGGMNKENVIQVMVKALVDDIVEF